MQRDETQEAVSAYLHGRKVARARDAGHLFADAYYGDEAYSPTWADWARRLPVYALALTPLQNPDGSLPFILDILGLGDAPLS